MYPGRGRKPSPPTTTSPTKPVLRPQLQSNSSSPPPASMRPQALSPRFGNSPTKQSHPRPQTPNSLLNRTHKSSPQRKYENKTPAATSATAGYMRPILTQQALEGSHSELRLNVYNLPTNWDTKAVYNEFERRGTLVKIDIQEGRGNEPRKTFIVFSPPPENTEWCTNGISIGKERVRFHICAPGKLNLYESPKDPGRKFAEETKVPASDLNFGVMKTDNQMLVLSSVKAATSLPMSLELNLKRKGLDVNFAMLSSANISNKQQIPKSYKMRLNFPQIRSIVQMERDTTGQRAWIISVDQPPLIFRKADVIEDTHEDGATFWNDWQTLYRQTEINASHGTSQAAITQLQREPACIDIGRWLTYRLIFDKSTVESSAFMEISQAVDDHDMQIVRDKDVTFEFDQSRFLWSWLDNSFDVLDIAENSTLSELHQLAEEAVHLPFDVRYQLEVCISHGILHECNITKDFLRKLKGMETRLATKLLEKVADEKDQFYDPEDIFRRVLHKISVVNKPLPAYCAVIRAAIITPTTIYFMTPVSETSNRVVRKFQHYEDRFLRVRFTDERYKGRVQSFADSSMNEVYTRVKRTMKNGIRVGDRHYDFLAFGNSQFREHGAWFFAPTGDITAQKIRDNLGDFSNINIVAKYCSRVGQCFSTTRATNWSVSAAKIPDIERNGFCFTDGVGKISQFLAQMIAQELGYPSSSKDFPSAFQFRREGCKGILVVDPALKKHTIHIRDSQEKFAGTAHRGLEIVRVSQFSTAYLNVQLILVLSALGVEDGIFIQMMRSALQELQEAMFNETKALELLHKNVDYNNMTIQLASMVLDGFMEMKDPFTISCLRLWRAWSVKYLKEKSRIFVENGAFVLGCVDETATLKGHFNGTESSPEECQDSTSLPEIFLQIDPSGEGKWKVIEGICTLARNPSLHPGDVRVVHAVDVQELHHIRNCVVFPQTGDRDLGNMCSGGDLDGDDYLVVWDQDLMPKEWNHPPMDYTAAPPVKSDGKVTVDNMTSFFVTHMKKDNLGPIAVAHRYWADQLPEGVKDPKCLELAQLHSRAVDYAKTGVAADMPKRLRVKAWPHWSEPKNKPWYKSRKVIGQLYNEVQRVPFNPAWSMPFDQRILEAYELDDKVLGHAREVKQLYDTALRRVMAKFSIENEFEVWSTFVLKHSDDMSDYKFAETIGEATSVLKDVHQKLCYEKAGTNDQERDWLKMRPFIAAMYTITAEEITAAMAKCNKVQLKGGQLVPVDQPSFENMPFMSFPWLFPAELGRIANKREDRRVSLPDTVVMSRIQPIRKPLDYLPSDVNLLEELEEVKIPGEDFESTSLLERRDSPLYFCPTADNDSIPTSMGLSDLAEITVASPIPTNETANHEVSPTLNSRNIAKVATAIHTKQSAELAGLQTDEIVEGDVADEETDEDEEVKHVTLDVKASALDAFDAFMGL